MATYRFVDLVLLLVSPTGSCEAWVEVMVGSGINGDQLGQYRKYIDEHQREMLRELVLLAPEPLPADVPLVQMRWQNIAGAVQSTARSNLLGASGHVVGSALVVHQLP